METQTAPDLTPGYPSRGARLGPAWADAWAVLTKYPEDWHDGPDLWTEVADRHGLAPASVRGLLYRFAKSGVLESETRQVITGKGKRAHTHFRYARKDS